MIGGLTKRRNLGTEADIHREETRDTERTSYEDRIGVMLRNAYDCY